MRKSKNKTRIKGGKPGDYNPAITQSLQDILPIVDDAEPRLQDSDVDIIFFHLFHQIGEHAAHLLEITRDHLYSDTERKRFLSEFRRLLLQMTNKLKENPDYPRGGYVIGEQDRLLVIYSRIRLNMYPPPNPPSNPPSNQR